MTGEDGDKTQRSEEWQGASVGAVSAKMFLVFVFGAKPALRPRDRPSRGRAAYTRAKRSGKDAETTASFSMLGIFEAVHPATPLISCLERTNHPAWSFDIQMPLCALLSSRHATLRPKKGGQPRMKDSRVSHLETILNWICLLSPASLPAKYIIFLDIDVSNGF